MIITKPQQFIIFDCDEPNLAISSLPTETKNKIDRIQKIRQPVGGTIVAWTNTSPQFSDLEKNTIYLVYTKPGQTGYEIPGAVEPIVSCLSNAVTVEESRYKGDFFKIVKDNEEIVVELTSLDGDVRNGIYLSGKAVKISKMYNKPWNFHIKELSFLKDLPAGYYELKPSTIQQLLENNQEIIVTYQLSSLDKIPITGVGGCGSPLVWECEKQTNLVSNQSELIGFCSGDCPEGYKKTSYDFNLKEYCIPIIDLESDSDLDLDSDSDFVLDFEKDFDSDNNLIIDYDSDSDTYYEPDSDSYDFDSDSDLPPYSGPELTDVYLINLIISDETLPQELRNYFMKILEGIQNG